MHPRVGAGTVPLAKVIMLMLPALRLWLIGTLAFATILPAQVPTFREVSGHDFGERITQHFEMQRYLERLAESSPRVKLIRQGESWEGRALMLAIVTSPENHARLETIRENSLRLADPRSTTAADAATIIAGQPVVAGYGG